MIWKYLLSYLMLSLRITHICAHSGNFKHLISTTVAEHTHLPTSFPDTLVSDVTVLKLFFIKLPVSFEVLLSYLKKKPPGQHLELRTYLSRAVQVTMDLRANSNEWNSLSVLLNMENGDILALHRPSPQRRQQTQNSNKLSLLFLFYRVKTQQN